MRDTLIMATGCLLAFVLVFSASCASDWNPTPVLPTYDLTGGYLSEQTVGELGQLLLVLERHKETSVFKATLSSIDNEELGESEGVGTLGDLHLILNFDRGLETDYYIETAVELDDGVVSGLVGSFIFPDHEQPRPITFRPI